MNTDASKKSFQVLNIISVLSAVFLAGATARTASAQGHGYINTMRSSTVSHVFVSQSVEGEYGKANVSGEIPASDTAPATPYVSRQFWKGYGIGTTLGLEIMKFIQFNIGHTFVNMANANDGLETLRGSRLSAGTRLVFLAPIGNLEAGGGILGSRLDYQNRMEAASFYGSGYYYSLGLNYYLNARVSAFGHAKIAREHLGRNGGSELVDSFLTSTTLMGVGFSLWL